MSEFCLFCLILSDSVGADSAACARCTSGLIRELAFRNLVPEHEMAVAPHRRGPNGKLMTPIDRETDVLWGYAAVWPRLLGFYSAILAQTQGRFAHCFASLELELDLCFRDKGIYFPFFCFYSIQQQN